MKGHYFYNSMPQDALEELHDTYESGDSKDLLKALESNLEDSKRFNDRCITLLFDETINRALQGNL